MDRPAVLSISSHVIKGSVGNRAAVFALQTLGFPVWCLNTLSLPWHPGHGLSTKSVPENSEFENQLRELSTSSAANQLGLVFTGYLANIRQIRAIAEFISDLKSRNTNLIYICDPILGDGDRLYVSSEVAEGISECLLPLADIVTPNCFELSYLSGAPKPDTLEATVRLARTLPSPIALVTSCPVGKGALTGNILVSQEQSLLAKHERFEAVPHGTGDLTAALFAGHFLESKELKAALKKTSASVFDAILRAVDEGSDEMPLEKISRSIIDPQTQIEIQTLEG